MRDERYLLWRNWTKNLWTWAYWDLRNKYENKGMVWKCASLYSKEDTALFFAQLRKASSQTVAISMQEIRGSCSGKLIWYRENIIFSSVFFFFFSSQLHSIIEFVTYPGCNHLSSPSLTAILVLTTIILCLDYCSIFLSGHLLSTFIPRTNSQLGSQKNIFIMEIRLCHSSIQNLLVITGFNKNENQSPYHGLQGHTWSVLSALWPCVLLVSIVF